nr:phosphoribosylanthranilate isomerase [Desulfobacterales bacterium]
MADNCPRIKICGITRKIDAQFAVSLGVDALGFIFAPSPRQISATKARDIIRSIPPFVAAVGVFVDEDLETVREVACYCGLDWVQLHGRETPGYCSSVGFKVLKAIRVMDKQSISAMAKYKEVVNGFVLDTYVKGMSGGTGRIFDWKIAGEAKRFGPIILSGGLTPENVETAIFKVKPYGVDVSSGVESSPGIKDDKKMRLFVERVRNLA